MNNSLMIKHVRVLFISALMAMSIVSCTNDPKPSPKTEISDPKSEIYTPVSPNFNADSAYYFVKTQVDFGPRVTNSEASKKCGDWLVKELKKYTDNVIEQKTVITNFDGNKLNVRNIIAEINPKASKRILLSAHWDSRDRADKDNVDVNKAILGANDGASGVGVLIEIARIIKSNPITTGIDIVLFDAEDLGNNQPNTYCLGSQYWAANLHRPGYKAEYGINLDMVGASNAFFGWEGNSLQYAKPILEKVWGTAHNIGSGKYFNYTQVGGIDDDHLYVNRAGIPTIDIIHFDATGSFPDHHHTHKDNMNVIDRNTLKAVGQTVLEVLYNEK
jgi:hypothetical protein